MIFITATFPVQPDYADRWPEITADFTSSTQAEPGCLWFFWSRSVEDPNLYVLVEAFRDDEAGSAHVNSPHFQTATRELPAYLTATPSVINTTIEGTQWSPLGEMSVD